jgi:molybdopterin molybdotransferase
MRPFGTLTPWIDALEVARGLSHPITATRRLSLLEATGRVLASDAVAAIDVPSADRAAMDGYAVRASDIGPGTALRTGERISAGDGTQAALPDAECVEIATGAPIPAGADAVVPVEHTERSGREVTFVEPVRCGDHISRCGEDLREGTAIARTGDRLNPALLSACVAGGVTSVEVWSRPRILVAPTGDEVVPLGHPMSPGKVYDSNAAGLQALADSCGARAEHAGIVLDRLDSLVGLLQQPEYDLIVTIGGTSVGRRDLVSTAMEQIGETSVHGVAVKPGKPLLLGRVAGCPMVGLPGFPTSCMMLAYAVVAPMIRRMAHGTAEPRAKRALLAEAVESPAGKVQLLPVALDGELARPTFRMSSAISSMAHADGWIEVAAQTRSLAAGAEVEARLF